MQSGGDAPTAQPAYAVGDSVRSGDCKGTVAAVAEWTFEIVWEDGDSPITYPIDATYIRKVMPWE